MLDLVQHEGDAEEEVVDWELFETEDSFTIEPGKTAVMFRRWYDANDNFYGWRVWSCTNSSQSDDTGVVVTATRDMPAIACKYIDSHLNMNYYSYFINTEDVPVLTIAGNSPKTGTRAESWVLLPKESWDGDYLIQWVQETAQLDPNRNRRVAKGHPSQELPIHLQEIR